jgi:hypothetical protein
MLNRRGFFRRLAGSTVAAAGALVARNGLARLACGQFTPFGVQTCEVGIDSDLFTVKARDTQHASEWCWAASIEMVFRYYGHNVPQERIVQETWGSIVNLPATSPLVILRDLNRSWVDDDGMSFRVSGTSYGANPVTAAQDLAADMPLIIGTMGHAMVLTALTYNRDVYGRGVVTSAIVRDPWPYPGLRDGRRVLSPQEWFSTSFLARIRVQ